MAAVNHIRRPIFRKCCDTLHNARGAPGRFDAPASVSLFLVERNAVQPFALVTLPALVAHHVGRFGILERISFVIIRAGSLAVRIDRIAHPQHVRQTALFGIGTLAVTALALRVPRTVFRIEQIRNILVHIPIYELESFSGVLGINRQVALRNGTGADDI